MYKKNSSDKSLAPEEVTFQNKVADTASPIYQLIVFVLWIILFFINSCYSDLYYTNQLDV